MSDQYGPTGWQPQNPGEPASGWPPQAPQAPGAQPGWPAPPAPGAQPGWPAPAPAAQNWPAQPPQPQTPPTWPAPAPQQNWPQPQGQPNWQPQPGQQPPAGKPKSRTPLILTIVAVVVALLAGGGIWYFAIRDTTTTAAGQATPQAAASSMLLSLTSKDVVGVVSQLDPSEAALFSDLQGDVFKQMERLGIIKAGTDPTKVTGTVISTKNLTFDDKAEEKVNDHVTIVKLTGGTVSVSIDPKQLPLSDKISGAFPQIQQQVKPVNQTVDIAAMVAKNGGQPFRIATVKRGDTWYPSLFYSLADNAYQQLVKGKSGAPAPGDLGSVTPIGGGSPEEAVNGLIDQALSGNIEGVIGMLPPDEMGALYDYARAFLAVGKVKTSPISGVKITDRQWQVDDTTGGKKVSLKSLSVATGGQTVSIVRDVATNTLTVTVPGQGRPIVLSPDTIGQYISQLTGGSAKIDPRLTEIIKREFVQVIGLGGTTVEVNGKWYVSPLRSYTGVLVSLLKGLEPADIDYFIELAKK